MLDESELDQSEVSLDDISVDETFYDETSGDLAYRWRDPFRPTGIGDDTDTWY